MAKFCNKPRVIEAEQWWPNREIAGVHYRTEYEVEDLDGARHVREDPYVTTIQGRDVPISPGEWIITEADGVHHYPCAPDTFKATYEPLSVTESAR